MKAEHKKIETKLKSTVVIKSSKYDKVFDELQKLKG